MELNEGDEVIFDHGFYDYNNIGLGPLWTAKECKGIIKQIFKNNQYNLVNPEAMVFIPEDGITIIKLLKELKPLPKGYFIPSYGGRSECNCTSWNLLHCGCKCGHFKKELP